MDASLILNKLTKFDNICRFFSIIEVKFLDDQEKNKDIRLVKSILSKSIIDFALGIERRFQSSNDKIELVDKMKHALKVAQAIPFLPEHVKDYSLLLSDLQDVILFLESCDAQNNEILVGDDIDKALTLKEKILLITSERFG